MPEAELHPAKVRRRLSGGYAIALGAFLFIEGVWGLFSNVVFGVLTTNITHAVIHIVLGAVGAGLGWRGPARGYCLFLGLLLPVTGLLRMLPATGPYVMEILNLNVAGARLNIIAGGIALLLSVLSGRGAPDVHDPKPRG
jgi:hypothetical protein